MAIVFKHRYKSDSLIGSGTYKFRPYAVTEDELAGTWVFNDTIDVSIDFLFNVNFTSNNTEYIGIATHTWAAIRRLSYMVAESRNIIAYSDGKFKWAEEAYKTITITSKLSEVENGATLLAWLPANATKQS